MSECVILQHTHTQWNTCGLVHNSNGIWYQNELCHLPLIFYFRSDWTVPFWLHRLLTNDSEPWKACENNVSSQRLKQTSVYFDRALIRWPLSDSMWAHSKVFTCFTHVHAPVSTSLANLLMVSRKAEEGLRRTKDLSESSFYPSLLPPLSFSHCVSVLALSP